MSETESNGSVVESMEELRRAGGDAWDKVPDVASELGRNEPTVEERLKALEARLSDVEARRREIEASAAEVDRLASSAEKKKAAYTAAKHAWEEAVECHMELSRHWSKSEEVASRPLIAACEAKADPLPADDSWRDEPVEVLQAYGLDANTVEWLNRDGLCTLGVLNDRGRAMGANSGPIFEAIEAYFDARAADVQDADDAEDEAEDDLDATEDAEAAVDGGYINLDEAQTEYAKGLKEFAEMAQQELSGLDLVTSRPDSDPESNGVEATEAKPKRRRNKAKA